jgi:Zn-dependent protease
MENLIQTITVYALPVIFAITLHEAAHAYVARYFGDLTAYAQGRVSLNPLRHIDLVGTIIVPLSILLLSKMFGMSGFLFGWAKPVPVNFANLRNPKRDMLWVAAAGPGINLVMALGWALFLKLQAMAGLGEEFFVEMAQVGIVINVVLAVLNLLPLPPLDGGRIMVSLLPHRLAWQFARIEPWGFPILILLMATGVLGGVLSPFIQFFITLINRLFFY